jgi:hypothetical protein
MKLCDDQGSRTPETIYRGCRGGNEDRHVYIPSQQFWFQLYIENDERIDPSRDDRQAGVRANEYGSCQINAEIPQEWRFSGER